MNKIKIFKPSSKLFISLCILINLFICGFVALFICGIVKTNWLYLSIGFLSFVLLLLEDINILTTKIILFDDFFIVNLKVFKRYFNYNKINKQKIYYNKIEQIAFTECPPIIEITCSNNKTPIYLYVKQFSRKQIKNILDDLNHLKKDKD